MSRCEICLSVKNVIAFWIGGQRPRETYRRPRANLCEDCQRTLAELLDQNEIHFQPSANLDTSSSRYSIVKAAIKRKRFGDPNLSVTEVLKQTEGK